MSDIPSCCAGKPVVPQKNMLRAYMPLVAMSAVSMAEALVLHHSYAMPLMTGFMGVWLIQFGLVKLFDLDGFVAMFRQYDVLAKRMHFYGYAFPFIELGLGLAYLGRFLPSVTSVVLLFIAGINLVGILSSYHRRGELHCACMGATVKIPLGFVAVVENGLMIVMAIMVFIQD